MRNIIRTFVFICVLSFFFSVIIVDKKIRSDVMNSRYAASKRLLRMYSNASATRLNAGTWAGINDTISSEFSPENKEISSKDKLELVQESVGLILARNTHCLECQKLGPMNLALEEVNNTEGLKQVTIGELGFVNDTSHAKHVSNEPNILYNSLIFISIHFI